MLVGQGGIEGFSDVEQVTPSMFSACSVGLVRGDSRLSFCIRKKIRRNKQQDVTENMRVGCRFISIRKFAGNKRQYVTENARVCVRVDQMVCLLLCLSVVYLLVCLS